MIELQCLGAQLPVWVGRVAGGVAQRIEFADITVAGQAAGLAIASQANQSILDLFELGTVFAQLAFGTGRLQGQRRVLQLNLAMRTELAA